MKAVSEKTAIFCKTKFEIIAMVGIRYGPIYSSRETIKITQQRLFSAYTTWVTTLSVKWTVGWCSKPTLGNWNSTGVRRVLHEQQLLRGRLGPLCIEESSESSNRPVTVNVPQFASMDILADVRRRISHRPRNKCVDDCPSPLVITPKFIVSMKPTALAYRP